MSLGLCGTVEAQGRILCSASAHDGDDLAVGLIDNGHGGFHLYASTVRGEEGVVRINGVKLCLNVAVDGGINGKTAAVKQVLCGLLVVVVGGLQILYDVVNERVHEPAVDRALADVAGALYQNELLLLRRTDLL